jgi:hypothetical protein
MEAYETYKALKDAPIVLDVTMRARAEPPDIIFGAVCS